MLRVVVEAFEQLAVIWDVVVSNAHEDLAFDLGKEKSFNQFIK